MIKEFIFSHFQQGSWISSQPFFCMTFCVYEVGFKKHRITTSQQVVTWACLWVVASCVFLSFASTFTKLKISGSGTKTQKQLHALTQLSDIQKSLFLRPWVNKYMSERGCRWLFTNDNTKKTLILSLYLKLKDTTISTVKCQCKCGEKSYSASSHDKYSCHGTDTGLPVNTSLYLDAVHSERFESICKYAQTEQQTARLLKLSFFWLKY